jgi:hypothetical protein
MSNRIYDSSQLTKRRAEKAIAGSFLSRLYPPIDPATQNPIRQPQQGSPPILGDYDSSIMYAVKTGGMTEYTSYPTCVGISPGCPCPDLNADLIPGAVTGITFTVGSIVVSWNPPRTRALATSYLITPYKNGVQQESVITSETSYRFTNITEGEPYTFTVCAMNANGQGPVVPSSSYFLAPPNGLSTIMDGGITADIVPSIKYVINAGLDSMLQYAATANLGPTRGSRIMYVWIASVAQAWNWIRSEKRVTGIHDNWNWDNKLVTPLSDNNSIIWLCNVIDYITPYFITSGYKSIYNCPASIVANVKSLGDWSTWSANWQTWYNYRVNDGSIAAATTQPNIGQNVNLNNPIIVDGITVNDINNFPGPQKWAALWLKNYSNTPQKYLTYLWDTVLSTCLNEGQEQAIQNTYVPKTGIDRDAEIDNVMNITANLNDVEKVCAEFWAGGPGTVSPPLMFIWLWKEYMRIYNFSNMQDIIYSLLDLSIHLFEGGRVTWRLKAANMESRPIQEIRRRFAGQQIASWNGTINGAQWIPYQAANFITPPFADFPSGHSQFSSGFALTMNRWFGPNINATTTYYDKQTLISPLFASNNTQLYGNFMITAGSSEIQSGIVPAANITLSFTNWNEMSSGTLGAGLSRLYGGIHCATANLSSQSIAVEIDELINDTSKNVNAWNIHTTNI